MPDSLLPYDYILTGSSVQQILQAKILEGVWGVPGGPVVTNVPCNIENTVSIPGLERSHMPKSYKPMCHNY